MRLSPDRQSYLARIISEGLAREGFVTAPSPEILFEKVKQAVRFFAEELEELDQKIADKISSIKRGIHPRSSEWEVLYSQFLEEEFRKKSRLFVKT